MNAECAFCGRADAASVAVYCDDCQAEHPVCRECAESTAADAASLGLEPIEAPIPHAA